MCYAWVSGGEGAGDHSDDLGSPESLETACIFSVFMSQSQVEKVITEGSLPASAFVGSMLGFGL